MLMRDISRDPAKFMRSEGRHFARTLLALTSVGDAIKVGAATYTKHMNGVPRGAIPLEYVTSRYSHYVGS